jgi:hypothetical protein
MIVSADPAAGAWKLTSAGTGLPITGVSCPALTACAAFDNNADAIVSAEPTGGPGAWSFENVVPFGGPEGNGTFGLSCPTVALCVAVGQHYQVLSSTDPFVRTLPELPAGAGAGRPRVAITFHPAKRIDARKGGVRISFRFRATAAATGFECKLDRRRFRPCMSPRRYRVGTGNHVFRVRAIASDGARGPRASFHFRVGRLNEPPPAGSCHVGAGAGRGRGCINPG